ncbi:hypothetical protein QBC43DRAFT_324430 [Cladorrhinum sp. PSN259]|nr:hypothetical protein QBC43DRAFT_324430 [Cladorrhinum sp. PSN259]
MIQRTSAMAAPSIEADHPPDGPIISSQRHYPVDMVHTYGDLHKYEHRRITARDILAHRLMSEIMSPSSETVRYHTQLSRLPLLGAPNIPKFFPYNSRPPFDTPSSKLAADFCLLESLVFSSPTPRTQADTVPTVHDRVLHLVARYYMENDDPALRIWISRTRPPRIPANFDSVLDDSSHIDRKSKQRLLRLKLECQRIAGLKHITDDHAALLQSLQSELERRDVFPLYDGGTSVAHFRKYIDQETRGLHGPRRGMNDTHWTINNEVAIWSHLPTWPANFPPPPFVARRGMLDQITLILRFNIKGEQNRFCCSLDLFSEPGPRRSRYRPKLPPRRCRSEPRWGLWGGFTVAKLPEPYRHQNYEVYFPTMTLSEMDRRSRRRSLSRRHVEDMFMQMNPRGRPDPEKGVNIDRWKPTCENCKDAHHATMECRAPCGFCGAPGRFAFDEAYTSIERDDLHRSEFDPRGPGYHGNPHFAPTCPVARENRCKCVPFPTFHTADRCSVPCRRDCGNGHATGSFKHKNAMTCRLRCCMCGIRGHSGKECRLKKCRCGQVHLGQDCGWNPTCRISGCDRYLCGMHCQDCGSLERPFVGKRCWKCLGFPAPLEHSDGRSGRRRRKTLSKEQQAEENKDDDQQEETMATRESGFITVIGPEAHQPPMTATAPSIPNEEDEKMGQNQSIFGDPKLAGTNNRSK